MFPHADEFKSFPYSTSSGTSSSFGSTPFLSLAEDNVIRPLLDANVERVDDASFGGSLNGDTYRSLQLRVVPAEQPSQLMHEQALRAGGGGSGGIVEEEGGAASFDDGGAHSLWANLAPAPFAMPSLSKHSKDALAPVSLSFSHMSIQQQPSFTLMPTLSSHLTTSAAPQLACSEKPCVPECPCYVEPHSTYSAHIDSADELLSALRNMLESRLIDHVVQESQYRMKGTMMNNNYPVQFRIFIYRNASTEEGAAPFLVEFQRRQGCVFVFNSFCKQAVEQLSYIFTSASSSSSSSSSSLLSAAAPPLQCGSPSFTTVPPESDATPVPMMFPSAVPDDIATPAMRAAGADVVLDSPTTDALYSMCSSQSPAIKADALRVFVTCTANSAANLSFLIQHRKKNKSATATATSATPPQSSSPQSPLSSSSSASPTTLPARLVALISGSLRAPNAVVQLLGARLLSNLVTGCTQHRSKLIELYVEPMIAVLTGTPPTSPTHTTTAATTAAAAVAAAGNHNTAKAAAAAAAAGSQSPAAAAAAVANSGAEGAAAAAATAAAATAATVVVEEALELRECKRTLATSLLTLAQSQPRALAAKTNLATLKHLTLSPDVRLKHAIIHSISCLTRV